MISEFRYRQRVTSTAWGVLSAAGLMFGLSLALVYVYVFSTGNPPFIQPLIGPVLILAGTASGGAAGMRIARLDWRQTVIAALLSGVGLIAFSRIETAPLFPGPWVPGGAGMVLDLRSASVYLVIGAAGVFFLPLFDPAVRRIGPAPSLWKVALVALALTLLALLADYLIVGGSSLGLAALIFGSVSSGVLAGLGIILALFRLAGAGAWLGGLGMMLQAFVAAAWWLLGAPFFP